MTGTEETKMKVRLRLHVKEKTKHTPENNSKCSDFLQAVIPLSSCRLLLYSNNEIMLQRVISESRISNSLDEKGVFQGVRVVDMKSV